MKIANYIMKLMTNSDIRKATLLLSTLMFTVLKSSAAENPPHVTVYGTATTSVAIDEMNWKIRISHKNPSLEEVAQAHNSTVKEVLDFLMENELPEHCIQTSGMEFGEHFISSKLKGRVRDGYQASSSINFKVAITSTNDNDLDRLNFSSKYKDLWTGISRMQNVSLNGITYDNSKRIKHQNETRKKALLAAKEKAETLAITLDSEIGKPLFIEEERFGYSRNNFNNVYATNEQAVINDAFAPGQIPITVQIKASFSLVTK
jgi:uncharacterized protein YggE